MLSDCNTTCSKIAVSNPRWRHRRFSTRRHTAEAAARPAAASCFTNVSEDAAYQHPHPTRSPRDVDRADRRASPIPARPDMCGRLRAHCLPAAGPRLSATHEPHEPDRTPTIRSVSFCYRLAVEYHGTLSHHRYVRGAVDRAAVVAPPHGFSPTVFHTSLSRKRKPERGDVCPTDSCPLV